MENNYKYFVFKNIYEKLGLSEIENDLVKKGIKYLEYTSEENELYRTISKFFLLKNSVDISSLNDDESENFKKYFSLPIDTITNNTSLLNEVYDYIEKTYKKILFPKIDENHCYYGPINMNYVAPRDSIVLGFEYYEFEIEENFDEIHETQQGIICDALNNIQFNLAPKAGYIVAVLKYNELYDRKKTL